MQATRFPSSRPEAAAVVAVVIFSAWATAAAGQASPVPGAPRGSPATLVAVAERISESIDLDGRLNEPAWAGARAIRDFRQIEPVQGATPTLATEVRLLFDATYLYVGIEARDPEGGSGIRAPELRRDFGDTDTDMAGIALDGFGDGRSAMAFQANPHGALRDLRALDGQYLDEEWQGVWDARTRIHEGGWTAELRIPWSTLRYDPGTESWRLMIVRRSRRLNEEVGWPEWPRQNNPYSMRFAGRLEGLVPPPPGRNIQIQPYLVARSEGNPAGGILGDDRSVDAGGEVKWAITPNTVLDLTANTDFAEADVDDEVVDLTRFSVFFPERRSFFLENAELFRAGGGQYVEPFFTRRVGLDATGRPIPLDGGARLTYQSAARSGGAMFLRQRQSGESPATYFAVGRIQQNIGRENRIGALAVSRFEEGGVRNHVGAVDFFYRPASRTFLRGMVSGSRTEGAPGGNGWSAYAHLANDFSWGYLGWIQALISSDYRADAGFIPRSDLVTTSPAASLDLRPSWLPAAVRSYAPGFTTVIYHRLSDGHFQEGWTQIRPLDFVFQDGSEASLWARQDWQRLDAPFSPVPRLYIPSGDHDYSTIGFTHVPDLSRPYWTYITVSTGGFFDGHIDRVVYRASPLPGPHVNVTFDYTGNRFRGVGVGDERKVITHLVGMRLRAAPNPRLQLSTFYQHNTAAGRGTLNARISWEFAPLSFAHLVLNDQRPVGTDPVGDGWPEVSRARQLLLKVSYLWAP